MHPTTYELLAKAHIQDLQPGRTWPGSTAEGGGSAGTPLAHRLAIRLAIRLATLLVTRFASPVAVLWRWVRRPVSA